MTFERWHKSVFHCVLALPIQAIAFFIAGEIASVVAVAMFFYSREIVQYQYSIKGDASTSTVWREGWNPLQWDARSRVDFLAPIFSSSLIALGISAVRNI
jgi:hypothetical protein